jgi:tellurium resistance protein TerZ
MGVSLSKGQRISLDKAAAGLSEVALGLRWGQRIKKGLFGTSREDVDLDASCLMFANGTNVDAVWFHKLSSSCGAVRHTGDDRSGGGSGDSDNETIHVRLADLPAQVDTLMFTVNSFLSDSFAGIPDAACRLLDVRSGNEIAAFNLSLEGGSHTGMLMAKLYRDRSGWHMQAIGEPGFGRTFEAMMPLIQAHL